MLKVLGKLENEVENMVSAAVKRISEKIVAFQKKLKTEPIEDHIKRIEKTLNELIPD